MLLTACWGDEAPPEPEGPPPAWVPPVRADHLLLVGPDLEKGPIPFRFANVSELYRRFFTAEEALPTLDAATAACLGDREAWNVVVTWDEAAKTGRALLDVRADALLCKAEKQAGTIDLSPLVPLTQGFAAWRDALAGARDLRLYSFQVGLHVRDAFGGVTLWSQGQHPPDGTTFAPCLAVDGFLQCPPNEADGPGTRWVIADGREGRRALELLTE